MEALKEHKLLLGIMSFLLIIKLGVIPLYDWQEQIQDKNKQLRLQADKLKNIANSSESNQEMSKSLSETLEVYANILYPNQPDSMFRISRQKELEHMLEGLELKVENFGWLPENVDVENGVKVYTAEIRIKGVAYRSVEFLLAIESLRPIIEVEKFNYSFRKPQKGKFGVVTGTVELNLYMKNETKV